MFKKILFGFIMTFVVSTSAFAITSQSELYSEEAMINYGYSRDFVDIMHKVQARSNGQPYNYEAEMPAYYKYGPLKKVKKVIDYIDPSSDTSQFLNHEIKPYPSTTDF